MVPGFEKSLDVMYCVFDKNISFEPQNPRDSDVIVKFVSRVDPEWDPEEVVQDVRTGICVATTEIPAPVSGSAIPTSEKSSRMILVSFRGLVSDITPLSQYPRT